MSSPIDCVFGSVEDVLKIASGQANKEAPHVTVPFYMPLAQSISLEEALRCCRSDISQHVRLGKISLLALAHGQMVDNAEKPKNVQFVLLFGTFDDSEPKGYFVFDTIAKEIEEAVLMDGDGTRFMLDRPLTQQEAVAMWIGGFLGWNENCPGLYRLRYALIETAD